MTDTTAAMQDAYRGAWESLLRTEEERRKRLTEKTKDPTLGDKVMQVMSDSRWRTSVDIGNSVSEMGKIYTRQNVDGVVRALMEAGKLKREKAETIYTYRIRRRT